MSAEPAAAIEVRMVEPGAIGVTIVVGTHRSATVFLGVLDALAFTQSMLVKTTNLAREMTRRQLEAAGKRLDTGGSSADRMILSAEEIAAQKNVIRMKPNT